MPDQPPNERKRRRPALDVRVPFFRPMWRRIAFVAVMVVWTAVEITRGSPWWALLTGGIGVYLFYEFFMIYDPKNYAGEKDEAGR